MLIRTGDLVEVTAGNAKGTRAKVLSVRPAKASAGGSAGKVVVEGVGRVYRHIKRSQKNPQGGRLSKELPIDVSNVLLVCGGCCKPARFGVRESADGGRVRVCRKCGAEQGVIRRPRAARATGTKPA